MKAFPQAIKESVFEHGMDLRDYFAAEVIIAAGFSRNTNKYDEEAAKRAYEIADAMMKARKQ